MDRAIILTTSPCVNRAIMVTSSPCVNRVLELTTSPCVSSRELKLTTSAWVNGESTSVTPLISSYFPPGRRTQKTRVGAAG